MNKQYFVSILAVCLLAFTQQQFAMSKDLKNQLKKYCGKSSSIAIKEFRKDLRSNKDSELLDLNVSTDRFKRCKLEVILSPYHRNPATTIQHMIAASNAGC